MNSQAGTIGKVRRIHARESNSRGCSWSLVTSLPGTSQEGLGSRRVILKNTLFLLDSKCLCMQDGTGGFLSAVHAFDTLLAYSGTKPMKKERQETC